MNEDFKDGIKIFSIDKEQEEMIIHLGNLNKFHREYKELKQENQQLKDRIDKAIEYNNQIIKDTEDFYYFGDCLIDLAERNISILKGEENEYRK